jgi:hypothetical protein
MNEPLFQHMHKHTSTPTRVRALAFNARMHARALAFNARMHAHTRPSARLKRTHAQEGAGDGRFATAGVYPPIAPTWLAGFPDSAYLVSGIPDSAYLVSGIPDSAYLVSGIPDSAYLVSGIPTRSARQASHSTSTQRRSGSGRR